MGRPGQLLGRWGVYLCCSFKKRILSNFTLSNCPKLMATYLLWKISVIWFLFEEKQFRGKEVIEQIGLASKHLHKRGTIANFCINTTIGKLLLKIGTMLGKAMLFQVIYLVCVRIFASF